jgi:hypothetical protein
MLLRISFAAIATVLLMSTPGVPQDRALTPHPEDCRAMPDDQGANDRRQPGEVDPQTTQSLTEKLDPCNGVLKPPPVGDQELTLPPPDTGEMRVIRPRDLPGQQSNPQ